MKTRKHIVKILYGFSAALIIVIIGLLVYQQRLIRQMSENDQQAPPAPAISDSNTLVENGTPTAPAAEGSVAQLEEKVETLRYQLEATEEELDMAREDLADGEGSRLRDISNIIAMEKKMRENPTLMNMRRRDQENSLDQTHGVLFERLGLPDEELQALKTLMVDYAMEASDMSLLIDQTLSEEEREGNLQLYQDQQAEFEKQAQELLGAENYEALDTYTRSLSERLFVHGLINPLSEDLGLSDDKEQALIDAMYEARQEVEAEYGFDSWDIAQAYDESRNPEDGINRQIEIFDRYIESARGILSEAQADQFETRVNENKEMMKMNFSFMGSGDDESE